MTLAAAGVAVTEKVAARNAALAAAASTDAVTPEADTSAKLADLQAQVASLEHTGGRVSAIETAHATRVRAQEVARLAAAGSAVANNAVTLARDAEKTALPPPEIDVHDLESRISRAEKLARRAKKAETAHAKRSAVPANCIGEECDPERHGAPDATSSQASQEELHRLAELAKMRESAEKALEAAVRAHAKVGEWSSPVAEWSTRIASVAASVSAKSEARLGPVKSAPLEVGSKLKPQPVA